MYTTPLLEIELAEKCYFGVRIGRMLMDHAVYSVQSLALGEIKKMNAAKLDMKRLEEMKIAGLDTAPPKPQVQIVCQRNHAHFYPVYCCIKWIRLI